MSPVLVENLERDIALIKKRRGVEAIHNGNEQPPLKRISFESPQLDRITSGGVPLGRMIRLWGPPSSGKTLIALNIIAAGQKLRTSKYPDGLQSIYYNIEGIYEEQFAATQGIDTKKLKISEGNITEDVAREMQLLLGSAHIHVVDSTSESIPQDRLNKDPGDWDVGLDIRVWNKCLGYIHNAMDKDDNLIVFIDHAGNKFDKKGGAGREFAKGGKELEFGSSMSMHCVKGKWLFYDEEGILQPEDKLKDKGIMGFAGQKEADGVEYVVQVNKSRVCRPLRTAHLRFDINKFKFDHIFELAEGAQYYDKNGNVAHRSGTPAIAQPAGKGGKNPGGWISLPGGEKIQGEKALRQIIDADKDLQRLIRRAMLAGN